MAKYTIELGDLVEKSNVDIGLKNYPLYDFKVKIPNIIDFGKDLKGQQITTYRDYLNNKIITHYYYREIGFETPSRFVFMLNRKMNEIMPYYNQLFSSVDIEFNPFDDVDMTESYTHTVNDTGNSNQSSNTNEKVIGKTTQTGENERVEKLEQNSDNTTNSGSVKTPNLTTDSINAEMDTPQSHMTNEQIKEHGYLSKASHNVNTSTGTESESINSTEDLKTTNDNLISDSNESTVDVDQTNESENNTVITNENNRVESFERRTVGSSPGYLFSQNIKFLRETFINIDMQIIEELEELFMQIF